MQKNRANFSPTQACIRNRTKIAAAVTNAQAFLKAQKEFWHFDKYI